MDNSRVILPELNELNIYEGGSLNEIKAEDLRDNVTAIKQLINSYNLKIKEIQLKQSEIINLKSDLEYQKTAPFISIVSMIVNLLGSTISAIAVNLLTADSPSKYSVWLLVIGFVLVAVGSLATILYPYAREFYNKIR